MNTIKAMTSGMKKIVFLFLLAMVAGIGAAHYFTPGHLILYHDSFRRLSYFPIVIGAILYGVWGGLGMALLSCLSFVPHLLTFWYQGPEAYYSELSEILFYLAAGLVIGMISSRENRLRAKYKRLSEQLAASYQRLHDQANELVRAEEELGRAGTLSLLGHVSASLAHEIKNPLASIKGAAEILADEVGKDHPKYEFVEIMRREISRLNNSVEDVLAYCRGQQGEERDEPAPLGQIADQALKVLGPKITEKAIQMDSQIDEAVQGVTLPFSAMTQVMVNLVLNAVEAVLAEGKIHLRISAGKRGLSIVVEDNGPGIDPEQYDRIFQTFVTFKEGGTGLGLAITQKIVQRLGGYISVDRSELGGAKFSIVLPVKEEAVYESDHSAH